ncbi:hypothetical protein [Streptomyces pseudogriseolus]|uniref:hypothetical protein n=1 Tax=Streptomyces pseudogriseolus TaxID=36817 RepID=UPI003FA30286
MTHLPHQPSEEWFGDRGDAIVAQGCDFWEWLACAGTVAGCAVSCTFKGTECFERNRRWAVAFDIPKHGGRARQAQLDIST